MFSGERRFYLEYIRLYFRVGDAACTIAASTCFPEPFMKPSDRKRLGWIHKKFSGTRNSDHVAMLWAYQQWEDAR